MAKRRYYTAIHMDATREITRVALYSSIKKLKMYIDTQTTQFTERTWRATLQKIHYCKPVYIQLPNERFLIVNECSV